MTLEEAERTLAVHALSSFVAAQAAATHMSEGGRIINIGSGFADRVPFPGVGLYAMSKSAQVGLTKGLARDLGKCGITVNVVHPGSTDTDMNPADGPDAEAEREYIALGRYAAPEDSDRGGARRRRRSLHHRGSDRGRRRLRGVTGRG